MHSAMLHKLVVLLCAAAAICAAAASRDVDTFSFPVFNSTTTEKLVAVNNTSILTTASLLFEPDRVFSEFNRSEGFLLLSRTVDVWRADARGIPDHEASFNTTFTLAGSSSVAFVVLKNSYPPLNTPDGFRGPANTAFAPDARASAGSLGAVEAGPVRSYGRDDPAVGLNVTITPNGTAPSRTVWIEYDAAAHHLSVYIAAGGQPKPAKAILDEALDLAGRTTEAASVGFFAGTIGDVIVGVRGWELTVDVLPGKSDGNRKKESSWVMVLLLAVLLSVAAAV